MILLQKCYIHILNPIYRINRNNKTLRYTIIQVCMFLLFSNILIGYSYTRLDTTILLNRIIISLVNIGDLGRSIIGTILLVIIIFSSIEEKPHVIPWKWYIFDIWMLFNIVVVIVGCMHEIGEGLLISQLVVMLLLPLFYFVWQINGNIEVIFNLLSRAIVILVFCYSIICLVNYPIETIGMRYEASTHNPNLLGFFAVVGCVASYYLINSQNKFLSFCAQISSGITIGFAIFSVSRSALISIVLSTIVWLIMMIKQGNCVKKIIVTIVVVCMSFSVFYFSVNRGSDNYDIYSNFVNSSYAYTNSTENSGSNNGTQSVIIDRIDDFSNLNQYSAGRIGIWKLYLDELNYTGHNVLYSLPIRVIKYDGTGTYYYMYAHNTALEFAFRTGIPSGILFIIIKLFAIIYCIKSILSKREEMNEYDLFIIMAILSFITISSVESVEFLFSRDITLIFYFACIPLFLNEKKESDKK